MIKVRVIRKFTLKDFDKIKPTLVRATNENKEGELEIGDTFECDKQMAEYLLGKNPYDSAFIEVIEVEPEIEEKKVETPKKKTTKKK
jgi:hypothetical protein